MATREIFWNISFFGEMLLYILAALAVGAFVYGIYRHVRRVLRGKPVSFSHRDLVRRVGRTLTTIATNRTVFRRHRLAGSMHLFILWGFVVLFIATLIVAVQYDLFHKILGMDHAILQGRFYLGFELVTDLFGGLLIVGIIIALVRRYVLQRSQLKRQPIDWMFPVWIVAIALTGFAVEGLRLAADAAKLRYAPGWSCSGGRGWWGRPGRPAYRSHAVVVGPRGFGLERHRPVAVRTEGDAPDRGWSESVLRRPAASGEIGASRCRRRLRAR